MTLYLYYLRNPRVPPTLLTLLCTFLGSGHQPWRIHESSIFENNLNKRYSPVIFLEGQGMDSMIKSVVREYDSRPLVVFLLTLSNPSRMTQRLQIFREYILPGRP